MAPQPLYRLEGVHPAYELRYGLTGWTSGGADFPACLPQALEELKTPWETDGLRFLELALKPPAIQITFSVTPQVAPVFFAARAKGRLQHGLRKQRFPVDFSRKVAMRSIGDTSREAVERYIARQVEEEPLADAAFKAMLAEFAVVNPKVDLSSPTETLSGRYWYNLHVVLTTAERHRIADRRRLELLRDQSFRIAEKKGHCISRLSAMLDRLHLALRGNIEHSPQEIALAFQNNLAFALGQCRVWQDTYYVATFSEYNMRSVRGTAEAAVAETGDSGVN